MEGKRLFHPTSIKSSSLILHPNSIFTNQTSCKSIVTKKSENIQKLGRICTQYLWRHARHQRTQTSKCPWCQLCTTTWRMVERRCSSSFITPALHGGEWSDSRPVRFTPQERTRVPIGYIACSWNPRAGLNAVYKIKSNLLPLSGIEPRSSKTKPSHYTDGATRFPPLLRCRKY
jgi:hypothetical protein